MDRDRQAERYRNTDTATTDHSIAHLNEDKFKNHGNNQTIL